MVDLKFQSYRQEGLRTLPTSVENGRAVIRPSFTITRHHGETLDTESGSVALDLAGPGDRKGIPEIVTRRLPIPDATAVEANYFPIIEFKEPDFPWRYTAAAPDSLGRWAPWICLLVFSDGEVTFTKQESGRSLGFITIVDGTPLPAPQNVWAWAHLQTHDASGSEVTISRLMCPRRLLNNTAYTVYLVPFYKAGAQAGLGETVNIADAIVPSWTGTSSSAKLRLPVYDFWHFQTGADGDFRALALRLVKGIVELPARVGSRPMDASHSPGGNLPAPSSTIPLNMSSALGSPNPEPDAWPEDEQIAWRTALVEVLNDSTSAVPRYGWRHRGRRALSLVDETEGNWFSELNLDPRLRAAAGLGTLVIRARQQEYLKRAWKQVRGIDEINNALAQAQFAREGATQIFERQYKPLVVTDGSGRANPGQLLLITGGLHSHVKTGNITVFAKARDSRVGLAVFDGAWRRITRPSSALGRQQGRGGTNPFDLFDSLNSGTVFPQAPLPNNLPTLTVAGFDPPEDLPYRDYFAMVETVAPDVRYDDILYECNEIDSAAPSEGDERDSETPDEDNVISDETAGERNEPDSETPDDNSHIGCSENIIDWGIFTDELGRLFDAIDTPQVDGHPPLPVLQVAEVAEDVLTAIDPQSTSVAALAGRLTMTGTAFPTIEMRANEDTDPLSPVFAAPTFPDPLFEPVRLLSQDWILTGLDAMPPESISLACVNWRVIEAIFVGANDEMARILLSDHYPADLRGTFFRQFWDPRDYRDNAGNPVTADYYPDIAPLHEWNEALGFNDNGELSLQQRSAGTTGEGCDTLTLVIRGELLRRYPNTKVYAVQAVKGDAQGSVRYPETSDFSNGTNQQPIRKSPVYNGRLEPDVVFYRFDLTEEQARDEGGVGYYFVLQEKNDEIRFGEDDVEGQVSLTSYFAPDELQEAGSAAPTRAAEVARDALRQPFLIAIHARRMLPDESTVE